MGLFAKPLTNTESYKAYLEPIVQIFRPHHRSDLHPAKVTSVLHISPNYIQVGLETKRQGFHFRAGQHTQLTLLKQGRYLSRCFSPATSPVQSEQEGKLTFGMRVHDDGEFTPYLAKHVKVGDTLWLGPAMGAFILQPNDQHRVFIAGGSGITPILSMLHTLPPDELSRAHLVFCLRNNQSIPFANELRQLQSLGLELTLHCSSVSGRFNEQALTQLKLSHQHALYVCGPQGLIALFQQYWQKHALPQHQLHFESFGLTPETPAPLNTGAQLPDRALVNFSRSNKQAIWQQHEAMPLLDFAEKQNLKPLFGCRAGVCHQCTCTKSSGRVMNRLSGKISGNGPEPIQLCQSLPLNDVTLDI